MEQEIARLLMQRDERALAEIRSAYGALCIGLAERMLGSSEDAEECFSDVLLAVWNSSDPVRPEGLRNYLAALTRRRAIDMLRARGRQKRAGTQFAAALDELAEILPAQDSDVEEALMQRELTDALTAWLRTLPPDTMRMFMQRYYLSEPVSVIAEKNGLRVSAVKMRLLRARRDLQDYLRKEELL